MIHLNSRNAAALAAALMTTFAGNALAAEQRILLRADTNRDGRIALTGSSDEAGKGAATLAKGALVLANIDDDSGRCAPLGLTEARQACFDSADEIINGDDDLLDLAELRTVPAPRAPNGATATIAIEGVGAAYGRLFVGQGLRASGYKLVTPGTVFTTAQLREGLSFRLEAKTFARDLAVWDGTFTVALTARRGSKSVTDRVTLRVAPLLTHTHAQQASELYTSTRPGYPKSSAQFLGDLRKASEPLGIAMTDFPTMAPGDTDDEWTQDYNEPMYASVPLAGAPGGVQSMRVLMRSEQVRVQQLALFAWQGKDVAIGAITETDRDTVLADLGSSYDSFGNLETIPAHRGYPAGRQILGGQLNGTGPAKHYQTFLAAQAQSPLRLDTSWLMVGHVDEFVSFVPAATPLGFRILVADVDAAYAVIEAAVAAGYGSTPYSTSKYERKPPTLAKLLADDWVRTANNTARKAIESNLALIMAATGATAADVVRIPTLYESVFPLATAGVSSPKLRQWRAGASQRERAAFQAALARHALDGQAFPKNFLGALYPGAINLVVLDANNVSMAKQYAAVVNGVDIMQDAIEKVLKPLGITPNWTEDYQVYHLGGGEVHCGSNTLRAIQADWWSAPAR